MIEHNQSWNSYGVGNAENSSSRKTEKGSSSSVKNLLHLFNDETEEPIEHMPDYEQFVSGKFFLI